MQVYHHAGQRSARFSTIMQRLSSTKKKKTAKVAQLQKKKSLQEENPFWLFLVGHSSSIFTFPQKQKDFRLPLMWDIRLPFSVIFGFTHINGEIHFFHWCVEFHFFFHFGFTHINGRRQRQKIDCFSLGFALIKQNSNGPTNDEWKSIDF